MASLCWRLVNLLVVISFRIRYKRRSRQDLEGSIWPGLGCCEHRRLSVDGAYSISSGRIERIVHLTQQGHRQSHTRKK